MSIASLERAIPAADRILLDTTTLAAYLDGTEAVHPIAKHVVESFVVSGRNHAVISMITVMELLVRPMRATPPGHHTVLAFLRNTPNLGAVEVDLQVAQDAAFLRAAHRLSPPSALVVGTGLADQVAHIVTNDDAWDRRLMALRPPDRGRRPVLAPAIPVATRAVVIQVWTLEEPGNTLTRALGCRFPGLPRPDGDGPEEELHEPIALRTPGREGGDRRGDRCLRGALCRG